MTLRLYLECVLLYIFTPILYVLFFRDISLIPFIIMLGILSFLILLFDKSFRFKKEYFMLSKIKNIFSRVIFIIISIFLAAIFLYIFYSESFLFFIRKEPVFALLIFPLYSLFSVLPQTLLFRALFSHRYSTLFPKQYQIPISAVLFSFSHIVLLNPIAVILTFLGGLWFSYTYSKDSSIIGSVLEHGIIGSGLFILGYGIFLYSGFN